ncbi:PRP3-domain-containing protein [Nadsonia fulvescens var. elongata DSM 6958]|uniref:PRP3-domain-containing protein n=1 Tax=Nadsonia fulvescens var. elongata DSM 6958 TaxID=857566 RepID=A0A1E3PR32_9ASCO|nr:PRP3-domain-containing protein [Nadsonia fulvescens var. elongata DSM 6958]
MLAKIRARKALLEKNKLQTAEPFQEADKKHRLISTPTQISTQTNSATSSSKTNIKSPSSPALNLGLNTTIHPSLLKTKSPPNSSLGLGLNTAVHPSLLETESNQTRARLQQAFSNSKSRGKNPYLSNIYDEEKGGLVRVKNRSRRALTFNAPGKFVAQANELRHEAHLEELKKTAAKPKAELAGIEIDEALGEQNYQILPPPLAEWWDEPYLKNKTYDDLDNESNLKIVTEDSEITFYVNHPIPIQAPWEKHLPPPKPLYLTKKEVKRIRKNQRAEKHKEKQDRIRLGLDPAPPPKVKLTNLMSVLTNEAIKDPTQVEMRVRHEVEQRRIKHIKENEDRKLTPEERHSKLLAKTEESKAKGLFCAVFKVLQLNNPAHRYKINVNARETHLTGITIINPAFNLIIVEGGAKEIKFYKRLMLNRIQWTENSLPRNAEDSQNPDYQVDLTNNKCYMIWNGQIKDCSFKKWSTSHTDSEEHAIEILSWNNADSFWTSAKAYNPM